MHALHLSTVWSNVLNVVELMPPKLGSVTGVAQRSVNDAK